MTIDEQVEKRVYNRLRAYDGVEVAGHAPVNSSIASVLSEGEVLADNGEQYSSIQQAVDVSDGFVFVGPGTYYENVVIDKDDFMLQGAGRDTLIDGGTVGHVLNAKGNNCTIKNLSVSGTNDNTEYNGIRITGGSGCKILQCVVRDSDGEGILIRGPDTVVDSCIVEDAGKDPIRSDSERCIIKNCVIDETSANDRFPHSITVNADMIVANCVVRVGTTTSSDKPDGIALNFTTDSIVIGNRVMNAKRRGISTQNTDVGHIIANNRVSDSAESDIDNLGSGIVIEGNLTGTAN